MNILKGVSLKLHSTMRLGGTADYLVNIRTRDDLVKAEQWAEQRNLPVRMIGEGSNIIWRDEGFKGLLMINKIRGFKKLHEDDASATYQIGAGENWDKTVQRLVELKLQGVECLSLIPGSAGATPVQNVGAYGQEIADTLVEVEAYDRMKRDFSVLANNECTFGYRASRFKGIDNGRFLICSITLKLRKSAYEGIFYEALQNHFNEKKISNPTLAQIRQGVITIRTQKLPDPMEHPNSGSFFANPIIGRKHYKKIKSKHKNIKAWKLDDNSYKISAAWLLEQAGFKSKLDPETGMSTWKNQTLVLVNKRAKQSIDLLKFQDKITDKVHEMFLITLEREPELLP